jgi:uncharacterized protein YcbX
MEMAAAGQIESLWRYPVKSMRGEKLDEAFVRFGGLRGDRAYAIHSATARPDFPYLTAREQGKLLLCRPIQGDGDSALQVETPDGETFEVEDPRLLESLATGLPEPFVLTLMKSDCPLTDSSPVSLISVQTVARLSEELGGPLDKRRFRANVYLDLGNGASFVEDQFVGHKLRIGSEVLLAVVQRDVRCKMITLDPDTFEPNPELMRVVARSHNKCAGVYTNVLAEGVIRPGDLIEVLG